MRVDPKAIAQRLRNHLCDCILPFWLEHSIDHQAGGFITDLERDGQRTGETAKNLTMQARMIDAFALGADLTGDKRYMEAARQGFRFLADVMYSAEDHRWLNRVDREGQPLADRVYAFDLTSVVFALANFSRLADEPRALDMALFTHEQLQLIFWDTRNGGYFDSLDENWQVDQTTKSLDVHLHAIEALIALYDVSHDERISETLSAVADLIITRMAQRPDLPAIERLTQDWSDTDEGAESVVEYGHLFKAAWLALEAFRRRRIVEYRRFALGQLTHVMEFGIDPDGGVYESGLPVGGVVEARHSWWHQCEAIAALARAWAVVGGDGWAAQLQSAVDYAFRHFHDTEYGEWYSTLGGDNEVVDSRKGHDRKCAYPIVRAFAAAVDDLSFCKPVDVS